MKTITYNISLIQIEIKIIIPDNFLVEFYLGGSNTFVYFFCDFIIRMDLKIYFYRITDAYTMIDQINTCFFNNSLSDAKRTLKAITFFFSLGLPT